jgi:serine/threonine protein kinase
MEYVGGGELFDQVAASSHLPEDVARYFFQQLILGLEYCHFQV